MNNIIKHITEIFNSTDKTITFCITAAICVILVLFHKQISKAVLTFVAKLIYKDKEEYKNTFVNSLVKPLSILLIIIGLLILHYFNFFSPSIFKMFKIIIILIVCWCITSYLSQNLYLILHFAGSQTDNMNTTAIKFISNILKIIVIAFTVVMALSELGYNINGLITGIGVGGLAISLAAQEAVSNMISGFVIIFEKPFIVGDQILTSDLKGFVIEVKMRSTTIRTVEGSIVTIPNSTLTKEPIINLTRVDKWRILSTIGLEYSTDNELLEKCRKDIEDFLVSNENISPNPIRVNFSKLDDSSLELSICCYANTPDYDEYLKIENNVNFKIKEIVEKNGAKFAFPSTSVYIANK